MTVWDGGTFASVPEERNPLMHKTEEIKHPLKAKGTARHCLPPAMASTSEDLDANCWRRPPNTTGR